MSRNESLTPYSPWLILTIRPREKPILIRKIGFGTVRGGVGSPSGSLRKWEIASHIPPRSAGFVDRYQGHEICLFPQMFELTPDCVVGGYQVIS